MPYRIAVTVTKFELTADVDVWPFSRGEIVLRSSVTRDDRDEGTYVTRFPRTGALSVRPRDSVDVDGLVYDGTFDERGELVVRLRATDIDPLCSDDLGLYWRRFTGRVARWAGEHHDSVGAYRVWLRIDVDEIAEEPEKRDTDPVSRNEVEAALDRRRRLRDRSRLEIDPALDAPAKPQLWTGRDAIDLDVAKAPRVVPSFGAVGEVLRVPKRATGVLTMPAAREALAGLDPGSIRLFRWSERRNRWRMISGSGLGRDSSYVLGPVVTPGLYAAFGLPADPARRDTLRMYMTMSRWMPAESAALGGGIPAKERLCALILCAPFMQQITPEIFTQAGLDPAITEWRRPPRFDPDAGPGGWPDGGPEGGDLPMPERFPPEPPPDLPRGNICDDCLGLPTWEPELPDWERGDPRWDPGFPEIDVFEEPDTCERWEAYGPFDWGGRVKALAFHSNDSDVIYMGNAQGGVYRSDNHGATWVPMQRGMLNTSIGALVVHPDDGDIVYAATAEFPNGGNGWNAGIGIYKTTDGGGTWDLLSTPTNDRYNRLILHPDQPDTIYGVGTGGVERSFDGGITWDTILATYCSDAVLDPTNPDRLIVACENGDPFRETNKARDPVVDDWTALTAGLNLGNRSGSKYRRVTASKRADGELVLWCKSNAVDTDDDGNESNVVHVYRWNLDDAEWELRRSANGNTQGMYNNVLEIDPNNPDVIFSAERGLNWSSDAGFTWESGVSTGHSDIHAILVDPSDATKVWIGNDGGVYLLTRPAPGSGITSPTPTGTFSWEDRNTGNDTLEFRNCSVSRQGTFTLAGSTQDQYVHAVTGTNYRRIRGTENGPVEVWAKNGNTIWWDPGGGPAYGIQSTRDGGTTVRFAGSGTYFWTGATRVLRIHPTDRRFGLAAIDGNTGQSTPGTIFKTRNGAGEPSENLVRLPRAAAHNLGDFTFSAWIATHSREFKGSAVYNTGDYAIVSGANAGADNEMLLFRRAGDSEADAPVETFETFLKGSQKIFDLPGRIEDGDWHHVCWVREGTKQRLYVDGTALIVNGSTPATTDADAPADALDIALEGLVLGQEQDDVLGGFDYNQAFQDRMRDIAFYASALDGAQIQALAGGGDPGVPPAHAWPLAGDGTASAGGAGATLVGVAATSDGVDFAAFRPVLELSTIVEAPPEVLDGATDFSVAVWVRPSKSGPYALVSAAGSGDGTDANNFLLYVQNPANIEILFRGEGRVFAAPPGIQLDADTWRHVAVARAGSELRVWVDGTPANAPGGGNVATVPTDALVVEADTLDYADTRAFAPRSGLLIGQEQDLLGKNLDFGQSYAGRMDDLRFYDGGLDGTQVQSLFDTGATTADGSLRAHYRFDGNGNDETAAQRHLKLPPTAKFEDGKNGPALAFIRSTRRITDIVYASSDPDRVYAADGIGRLWVSDDGGDTWTSREGPRGDTQIWRIAVDWDDADRIVVGFADASGPTVWRSDDAGDTWTDATGDQPLRSIPQSAVRGIVIDRDDDHTFYVATVVGVYRTRNEGRSWRSFQDGLSEAVPTSLVLRTANNTLYLATYGRAWWKRKL